MTTPPNTENTSFVISITREQMANMPIAAFPGRVVVVDTQAKADVALQDLNHHTRVGFDTETRPSFKKGKVNNVALIQISTDSTCYLFRTNKLGIHDGLFRFIEDPEIEKVGLSLRDDFSVMHRSSPIEPGSFIDLQNIVHQYHIEDIGLQKLYAILFGQRISKGQRLSNWEAQDLTNNQRQYAAMDAWACLRIYNTLTSGNFKPQDSPYAHPVEQGVEDGGEEVEA